MLLLPIGTQKARRSRIQAYICGYRGLRTMVIPCYIGYEARNNLVLNPY